MFWAIGCHNLWRWCNNVGYNNVYERPYNLGNFVVQMMKDYDNVTINNRVSVGGDEQPIMVRWEPLVSNWIKLNIYGESKANMVVGCGGIIRDSQGRCKGGFSKPYKCVVQIRLNYRAYSKG